MNKIVSTKTNSAVFLAIILVAGGVIGISSPFTAFAEEYGYDSKYPPKDGKYDFTAFGQELKYDNKYPLEYPDKNNYYNSYESTAAADYGMDDNNYKKSYGKDSNSYESQYLSSYKPNYYKPEYQSYGKDNYKKDSTIIKKINCINFSVNIKGDNSGDINIGETGQVVPYAAAAEYGTGGERYNNGYNDGFYKKDKDFGCIINNNINQVVDGDDKCAEEVKDCYERILTSNQFRQLEKALQRGIPVIPIDGDYDTNPITLKF